MYVLKLVLEIHVSHLHRTQLKFYKGAFKLHVNPHITPYWVELSWMTCYIMHVGKCTEIAVNHGNLHNNNNNNNNNNYYYYYYYYFRKNVYMCAKYLHTLEQDWAPFATFHLLQSQLHTHLSVHWFVPCCLSSRSTFLSAPGHYRLRWGGHQKESQALTL